MIPGPVVWCPFPKQIFCNAPALSNDHRSFAPSSPSQIEMVTEIETLMAAVVLMATLTAASPSVMDGSTHVRPRSSLAQAVVDDAVRASPTVEAMIAALEHTDVFVYVDARFTARSWRGGTRLVGAGV